MQFATTIVCALFAQAAAAYSFPADEQKPSAAVVVGEVRVSALSPSLIRIEPKGPAGFEDRETLMVQSRDFAGDPTIHLINQSQATGQAWIGTAQHLIYIKQTGAKISAAVSLRSAEYGRDQGMCSQAAGTRTDCGHPAITEEQCQAKQCCWNITTQKPGTPVCYFPSGGPVPPPRPTPAPSPPPPAPTPAPTPPSPFIWSVEDLRLVNNTLWWPEPLQQAAYAIKDRPRMVVPPWGPTPPPSNASIDPALRSSNGYDWRNDVDGDTYVFLGLDRDADSWHARRREFLALTGPTPLLPDWAYGTWYSYYRLPLSSEAQSRDELARWENSSLPIDVWGYDMNWRELSCQHDYEPNNKSYPGLGGEGTAWFRYLQSKGVRSFFNDHPYPVAAQLSPQEVSFRWESLTDWLRKGLTFWWIDCNWNFGIPPPNNGSAPAPPGHAQYSCRGPPGKQVCSGRMAWEGLDNRVWASHVYYEITKHFIERQRQRRQQQQQQEGWQRETRQQGQEQRQPQSQPQLEQRPLALSLSSYNECKGTELCQEHPAHHRYPVQWSGDGIQFSTSVSAMGSSALHEFKNFVHGDCGGDGYTVNSTGGNLVRFISHCAMGNILRIHGCGGNTHGPPDPNVVTSNPCLQPWVFGPAHESVIRKYLQMRYTLMPSIIAAGHIISSTGFPSLVARGDMFWPRLGKYPPPGTHGKRFFAAADDQYLFVNDTLVAPMIEWGKSSGDEDAPTTRTVWIPPGDWHDAWNGSTVSGGANGTTRTVTQPYDRLPMWHRSGGLVVTTDQPGLRVETQDWSTLTLQAFPHAHARAHTAETTETTERHVYNKLADSNAPDSATHPGHTTISMTTVSSPSSPLSPSVHFRISAASDSAPRAWRLRLHLRPGQRVLAATMVTTTAKAPMGDPSSHSSPPSSIRLRHLLPHLDADTLDEKWMPFGSRGVPPPPNAGPVAELELPTGAGEREVRISLGALI